jgi:hypothetical protein
MLGGAVLAWASSLNDLGIMMDEKMTLSEHVDFMVVKAFAMLGFIRRLSLEFRDPYTLKSLYTSLVRPNLEYTFIFRLHLFKLQTVLIPTSFGCLKFYRIKFGNFCASTFHCQLQTLLVIDFLVECFFFGMHS